MALVVTPISSRFTLAVNTGPDDEGNPILRNRSFSGVKLTASNQEVYDAAMILVELQQHPVEEISRINAEGLADE